MIPSALLRRLFRRRARAALEDDASPFGPLSDNAITLLARLQIRAKKNPIDVDVDNDRVILDGLDVTDDVSSWFATIRSDKSFDGTFMIGSSSIHVNGKYHW